MLKTPGAFEIITPFLQRFGETHVDDLSVHGDACGWYVVGFGWYVVGCGRYGVVEGCVGCGLYGVVGRGWILQQISVSTLQNWSWKINKKNIVSNGWVGFLYKLTLKLFQYKRHK